MFLPRQISYFCNLSAVAFSTPHLANQARGILNSRPSSSRAINFWSWTSQDRIWGGESFLAVALGGLLGWGIVWRWFI